MSASERKIAELEAKVVRLERLLGEQMRTGEELEWSAIVNESGEPKIDIRWDNLAAQVEPEVARAMAFDILRVCEWAETDSKVFRLIGAEFDERTARAMMVMLRQGRGSDSQSSGRSHPRTEAV